MIYVSQDPSRRTTFSAYKKGIQDMSNNIFSLLANEEQFTDELFAFVTDHNANSRNERAIVSVLHEIAPHIVSVAECMVIDGVDERHYVEEYVHAILHGVGLQDH